MKKRKEYFEGLRKKKKTIWELMQKMETNGSWSCDPWPSSMRWSDTMRTL
jgi:hypothetical protein